MAPEDLKTKKRKGAADASPKPKKQKKANDATTAKKASAKALDAAVQPLDELSVGSKPSRKRAIDSWDDNTSVANRESEKQIKANKKTKAAVLANGDTDGAEVGEKQKKAKKSKVLEQQVVNDAAVDEATTKSKKTKKAKQIDEPEEESAKKPKKAKVAVEEDVHAVTESKTTKAPTSKKQKEATSLIMDESEDSGSEDEDDQTAALLAGFESDRDESDAEKEDDGGVDIEASQDLPEEARSQLAKVKKSSNRDEPGVVFIGRIPHGFYEPQMKAYFKQFGKVTRLRLSRSKKTGASKHYAFVEFASDEVADIVARTMNNYLMFGHVLQCRLIPSEQIHPNLFAGAKGRFKRMPRNKMVGAQMARGAERDVWEKRVEKENKRRSLRNKALKEQLGYEFTAPNVTAVEAVPKKVPKVADSASTQLLLEAAPGEVSIIEAESHPNGVTVTETVKVKKPKKGAKGKGEPATEVIEAAEIVETVTEEKPKKGKKPKSLVTETEELQIASPAEGEATGPRKTRKTEKIAEPDVNVNLKKTRKSRG